MPMLANRNIDVIVREMVEDNRYTNDLLFLQRLFSYVPVFIYGTQQRGFSYHDLMGGFTRLGVGRTVDTNFVMYQCDNEPVVLRQPEKVQCGRVYGEVYRVPPSVVADLDRCFCKGIHFRREMVAVEFWQPEATSNDEYRAEALMYIGLDAEWEKAFAKGGLKQKDVSVNAGGRFYRFAHQDDQPNRTRDTAHVHVV